MEEIDSDDVWVSSVETTFPSERKKKTKKEKRQKEGELVECTPGRGGPLHCIYMRLLLHPRGELAIGFPSIHQSPCVLSSLSRLWSRIVSCSFRPSSVLVSRGVSSSFSSLGISQGYYPHYCLFGSF